MLIDWFTVGAQALNFIILVWLLKRFLYKPILHAVDAREKRIATELADADAKKAEAQKERDEFQHKNEEFDQQRAALMSAATDEAKAERQRLIDEARKAADALSAKRQETLRNDAHNLNQAITRRLREMDGKAKEGLAEALKTASGPALVRSAFDLPVEQRAAIQNALNETFAAEIRVRFETAPNLVSGIELTTNGRKVAWSIADYLASLEKGVGELLKEKDKPEAKAEAKPAAKAEPKPEAKGEPKPKTKTEPKPEAKAEPKPEPKAEPKPEAKAEPKPEAKAEPKPEAKAGPKPAAKAEPKPEEPKPETKSQ